MRYLLFIWLYICSNYSFAQKNTHLTGVISSSDKQLLDKVTVQVVGTKSGTVSNSEGQYSLSVPPGDVSVSFTHSGYKPVIISLQLSGIRSYNYDVAMVPISLSLDEVNITDERQSIGNTVFLDPLSSSTLPSPSGNFESILKTVQGVSVNNELSAQYSVRGGNFDENLVYINDIEVYRPFLVHNGQQEGLSFINPDLISNVRFSAGGFAAKYGDKLSSVLDVKYSKPDSTEINVTLGVTGYSGALKYLGKKNTSYLLAGVRKKANQSILNSQSVNGIYAPYFYDLQFLYHADFHPKWGVSFLSNYNLSRFHFTPVNSETKFGTLEEQLRLQIYYDGREKDNYQSLMGGVTLTFKPSDRWNINWITSSFRINEKETFDIRGRYIFDQSSTGNQTIGTNINFADNQLEANIFSTEIKTYLQSGKSFFEGGIRYQNDDINDSLNEYSLVDSAGVVLPLTDSILTNNQLSTSRVTGYIQDVISLTRRVTLSGGLRVNYNSRNNETLISPRLGILFQPSGKPHVLYRFSAGVYSQPGFYREIRDIDGSLNLSSKAQRSIHVLSGAVYTLNALGTEMKLTSELYYKFLRDLIPYKVDNIHIKYLANQRAKGYAAGLDLTFSGQFVKDLESSLRVSFMKTSENIENDVYIKRNGVGRDIKIEPGYLKRPTDQRINLSVFFQDRLFNNPSNKVHLSMLYGSALPVGPPGTERYRDVFKIPSYKRVDIGFSKDFLDPLMAGKKKSLGKYFDSLILYAGIFNLLANNNTISYLWIKDIQNNQFAVPNYLSGRQINLKIIAKIK